MSHKTFTIHPLIILYNIPRLSPELDNIINITYTKRNIYTHETDIIRCRFSLVFIVYTQLIIHTPDNLILSRDTCGHGER